MKSAILADVERLMREVLKDNLPEVEPDAPGKKIFKEKRQG